jgi:hypothetical protein
MQTIAQVANINPESREATTAAAVEEVTVAVVVITKQQLN